MGEGRTDEPHRLTVAQAADRLGISEGAVRSRIKRGTLPTERREGTVYVVFAGDEPPPHTDEPSDGPSADHRLIRSYEARIESLERALELEREANRENRRLLAAALERIPELEPPASGATEPRDARENAAGEVEREEPRSTTEGPQTGARRSWWRRIFGA